VEVEIYVCTNRGNGDAKFCGNKGSIRLLNAFKQVSKTLGIKAIVQPCNCLGMCGRGPNALIKPLGYVSGIKEDQVKLILLKAVERKTITLSRNYSLFSITSKYP
jgi:NADH:ubiquinone oxidoreductase subunit E